MGIILTFLLSTMMALPAYAVTCGSQGDVCGANQFCASGERSRRYCLDKPSTNHCAAGDAMCKCAYLENVPDSQYSQCINANGGREDSESVASGCVAEYNSLSSACNAELESAESSCDSKNNTGMNNVSNTASQLSVALGSQSAASITAACSTMGTLAGAANAAVAAYRMMCDSSISACKSACGQLQEFMSQNQQCIMMGGVQTTNVDVSRKVERCNALVSNVEEANQAITNLISTAKNASQCSSLTAGDVTVPAICVTNPTMVGCATTTAKDCTDPTTAATNTVCICSANPTSEKCISGMNSSGGAGVGGGTTDFSSRLANASTGAIGGDLNDLPEIMPGKPASGRGSAAADGKMGGAPVGGGSGGGDSGVPPLGGGGGGSSEDKYGTSGFYGGGGRGGGFGTAGSSRSGASGSGGGAGAAGDPNVNPDLRKFLPGGQFDPKRGMAGADGLDGITGPNTNIWLKIQNRYRVMSPTLLP